MTEPKPLSAFNPAAPVHAVCIRFKYVTRREAVRGWDRDDAIRNAWITAVTYPLGYQKVEQVEYLGVASKTPRPLPGDAVRLSHPWSWGMLETGSIGVINGVIAQYPVDGHASIVFNHSTFRDEGTVSSSGGPGTVATDLTELRATKEMTNLLVWRWKDGFAGAGNGRSYTVKVPVWEWNPSN
jgi:hypothetical protein